MDVHLPLVSSSLDLNSALDQLKTQNRSAVIAQHEGRYLLFTASNIAAGRHKGKTDLASLEADVAVAKVGEEKTLSVPVGVASGGGESGDWTSNSADFILKKAAGTTALLKVGNDALALKYSAGPTSYCCDGPRHHDDFPPPDVSVGDACPHNDGHKVIAI